MRRSETQTYGCLIWCPPTALDIIIKQPHHLPTAISFFFSFFFLDMNQNCAVIKIWFCAASLGKQVWVQEERKQPHSIWHTRVITGGRVLGHLYSVWGGGEVPPHHLGSILSPWRVRYQVCVSPALTITDCKATFTSLDEGVLNQNVNMIHFHVTITKCNQGYEK